MDRRINIEFLSNFLIAFKGSFNFSLSLNRTLPEKFLSMNLVTKNLKHITNELEIQAKEWQQKIPKILAVSKRQDIELVKQALNAGHRDFGENILQEAQKKWPLLRAEFPDVKLHLIGHLQSNKVKDALALFDIIETIDSEKLAKVIAKNYQKEIHNTEFLIQVNIGAEEQKYGIAINETDDFINYFCHELKLPLKGLMCIPPYQENPSLYFAFMHKIARRNNINYISQGMSSDYLKALQVGTSEIRVGSALFGARKY